jgi:hypothetical protein
MGRIEGVPNDYYEQLVVQFNRFRDAERLQSVESRVPQSAHDHHVNK